jgi:hypothetical protein
MHAGRSYEDVEAAAAGGGPGNQPLLKLTPVQRFGLLHRADLLEGASELKAAGWWVLC